MTIAIVEECPGPSPHKIRRRLGRLLRELGYAGHGLSVCLTDDEGIRRLNRDFRDRDASTNVLAFPDTPLALGQPRYLGDLVLSLPTVEREAAEQGQETGYLLYFYLTHGLLHLLGFDHEKGPAEEREQEEETLRLMALIRHDP
ncbi:MAG: rRNA maturation RNase YbeY [Deltaproteobacteria bacterium]|jgi:probable rRNA maturation factor|nr:rRNA maturation RNase YbeY [Deltaproteobacteria bacterium]